MRAGAVSLSEGVRLDCTRRGVKESHAEFGVVCSVGEGCVIGWDGF